MNERQSNAIRKFGSNPCWDPLAEEKFRKEFYGNQRPNKKAEPKKEEKEESENKAKPS